MASSVLMSARRRVFSPRFWLGGTFLRNVSFFRTLWLGGRYGGGKTSLAVLLADWLVSAGYAESVVCNFPCVLGTDANHLKVIRDAVIILDEAWMFLESWESVKQYAAFLRKQNLILLMPSVFPPHPKLRSLVCQRVFNGYGAGLPFWLFEYRLVAGFVRDKGRFVFLSPDAVFGLYDTAHVVCDDGGIVEALNRTFEDSTGVSRGVVSSLPPVTILPASGGASVSQEFDASDSMYQLGEALNEQLSRNRRRH